MTDFPRVIYLPKTFQNQQKYQNFLYCQMNEGALGFLQSPIPNPFKQSCEVSAGPHPALSSVRFSGGMCVCSGEQKISGMPAPATIPDGPDKRLWFSFPLMEIVRCRLIASAAISEQSSARILFFLWRAICRLLDICSAHRRLRSYGRS